MQNGYRADRFQPARLALLTDDKERGRSLFVLGQGRPPGGWEWLLAALPRSKPRELPHLLYLLEHWAAREAVPASFAPVLDRLLARSDKRLWLPAVMGRVPGSQLPEHHWTQAQKLLQRSPDTGELTLTLPDLNDPALAADVKLVESFNDGWRVAEKNLLYAYLSWVPLSRWATHWHLEPAQVVELAARSPHADLLLDEWLETTVNFGDVAAARALLAHYRRQPWETKGSLKLLRQHLTGALRLLPVAEQAAWRLSWLPAELPHAPVALPSHDRHPLTWLEWVTAHDSDPPPGLLLGLVPLMQAYFGQPPAPPSPVEAALARLLLDKVDRESPRLADAVEATLLPLARTQPTRPLGEAVLAVWPLLAFYRELAASLTAPAPTLPAAKHPLP